MKEIIQNIVCVKFFNTKYGKVVISMVQVVINGEVDHIEVKKIVADEERRFKKIGKQLEKIEITKNNNEISVKSYEKSPIKRIRRITGYMSTLDRFNAAKVDELKDRVVHC